jgi:enoyl-CoA hydratase/carnithine racemase
MIKFDVADRIGRLVIDRPDAGNAFTTEMARQFRLALEAAADGADIVVMTGAGPDFTVGRDRKEPRSGTPFDSFSAVSAMNQAIASFPGVLVAAVRGQVHGLGVGLVMRSDLAIGATDAEFLLDEVELGIPPMFIMEEMVEHLAPKQIFDLILTSRAFDADRALQLGVLSRVVAPADLESEVEKVVAILHQRDRHVVLACKRYLRAVGKLPRDARPAFALVEQTQFAMQQH